MCQNKKKRKKFYHSNLIISVTYFRILLLSHGNMQLGVVRSWEGASKSPDVTPWLPSKHSSPSNDDATLQHVNISWGYSIHMLHSAGLTAATWKFKLRVYFSHLLTRLVQSWYFKDDRKLFNLEMWTQLSDRESARISLLSLETHYKITIGNVRIQNALGLQKENKEWQIVALSI